MRSRFRAIPRALLLIEAVAAIQVVAWAFALAPVQGPDEVWHVAYVQKLAETGHPPQRNLGVTPMSSEESLLLREFDLDAAIGVPGAKPAWSEIDRQAWEKAQAELPDGSRSNGLGPNPIAQNPPLYYLWEAVPYLAASGLDLIDRLFVMALWNGLLYLATVAFIWLFAGELFRRRRLAQALAAATAALLPQLAWMAAEINPDTLLVTIWSAFFWIAARTLRVGLDFRHAVAVGTLAAAAVLTHGRGLALLVPAVVVLALGAWRARRALPALAGGALAGGGLALAFAWTSSSGGAVYGGEAAASSGGVSVAGFLSYVWQFYLPRLGFMDAAPGPDYGFREVFVEGFFGTFASLEVQYADWVYDLLLVAWLALAIAIATLLVRRRRGLSWPLAVVVATAIGALMFLLHRVAFEHLAGGGGDPIIQGRYVLPFAALFAVAVGWLAALLPPRWTMRYAAAVVVVLSLLQVAGIGLTFARFYA